MVFLFEIETSRLTSSSSLRWCQTIIRAGVKEAREDSEDIKTTKCAKCVGRFQVEGRSQQTSQLRRSSIVAPIVPLFTRRGTGTIWRFLISILADSGFPADQKLEPAVAVGQLARCPRSQVAAGSLHPSPWPSSSGALRCDQRWRLDDGRRRVAAGHHVGSVVCSSHSAPLTAAMALLEPGSWELGQSFTGGNRAGETLQPPLTTHFPKTGFHNPSPALTINRTNRPCLWWLNYCVRGAIRDLWPVFLVQDLESSQERARERGGQEMVWTVNICGAQVPSPPPHHLSLLALWLGKAWLTELATYLNTVNISRWNCAKCSKKKRKKTWMTL